MRNLGGNRTNHRSVFCEVISTHITTYYAGAARQQFPPIFVNFYSIKWIFTKVPHTETVLLYEQ